MFEEKALSAAQFAIPQKTRKSTDVICTVVGAALALTLFITACVLWNKEKFENKFFNIRNSQNGNPCREGTKLFYNDFTNATKSSCLLDCPVSYFERDGICLPENQNKFGEFLSNPDLAGPLQYTQFKWVLFYSFIVALGLGMLWLVLTQCFPREISILAHIAAPMALIAFGVLLLVLEDSFFRNLLWLKILVAVICFILAIISMVMVCIYANQVKFQSLFLDYSTRFLSHHPATGVYLVLYLIFMAGLVALIVWQHCCFTSQFAESRDFFNFTNTGAWEILNIIQFIWAAQFLRDSYNFCVSGCATNYYWRDEEKLGFFSPYKRLLCNHWGSVVGGSFLNAFFQIPTLIAQLLICHPTTCCSKLGAICYNSCNCLTCFFDLVRTDSYSYMNITGIPYCNSGRECKKICQNSKQFVGVHSPMKHYRFIAHVLLLTATLIAAWFILRARLWVYGFWNLVLVIVVIYITITWFIDLHADAAEGLQTSYLCQHELEPNHNLMQRLDMAFVADLDQWQRRQKSDGNL